MSIEIDKIQVLNTIKEYYKFKTDYEFAEYLGIRPTTLSSWYGRNTLNWDTIFAKCVEMDYNLLIKGLTMQTKTHPPVYDKSALEMIRDLSAENAMLKRDLDELQKLFHHKHK